MVPELKQEMKRLLSPESENSTHAVKKTNPKGEGKKKNQFTRENFCWLMRELDKKNITKILQCAVFYSFLWLWKQPFQEVTKGCVHTVCLKGKAWRVSQLSLSSWTFPMKLLTVPKSSLSTRKNIQVSEIRVWMWIQT